MLKYLIVIVLLVFVILVVSYPSYRITTNNIFRSNADDLPPVWIAGVEEQFGADVYSSVSTAASALAVQISAGLPEIISAQKTPPVIHIYTDSREDEVSIFASNALAEQLRREDERMEVFVHSNIMQEPLEKADSDTVIVKLEQARIENSSLNVSNNVHINSRNGTLVAKVSGSAGRLTKIVNFVEKSWLGNLSDLLNKNQNVNLIIARSQESCTSQAQAYQQAVDDAGQKITSIFKQLPKRSLSLLDDFKITASDILDNSLIIDKFAQSLQTSAGPVYRQALLIDISPEKINQLKLHKKVQLGSMRAWLFRQVFSIGCLAILISVLYFFLNAATRGYYSLALKVAAAVFIIAGAFLIYIFMT